jgi:Xaa-Pro aminopeptidase
MFDASTYADRRARLADAMPSGLCLFLGNRESPRNYPDNPYPFRQDSSLLYYLGIDTPGVDAVLDVDTGTTTLYGANPELDEVVWTGPQPSLADRAADAGVSQTAPPNALADDLHAALQRGRRVHLLPPYRDTHRRRIQHLLGICADRVDDYVSDAFVDAVIAQRSTKSDAEIEALEQAVRLTNRMHTEAMHRARPGTTEQEIVGALHGIVHAHGGQLSFPPICSIRGEVLHNHSYDNTLSDGDLLLVDAGGTAPSHYAGDVTRVTPVGGAFSPLQRDLYTAVLDAQEHAIEAMAPGVPFVDVHLRSARVLTQHLTDIGLMRGSVEDAVAEGAHALFFSHGLGHMMGLDVHDMEGLGEDRVGYAEDQTRSDQFGLSALRLARPLEPGFVVTVEPGLYFIPLLIEQWRSEQKHADFIDYDAVAEVVGAGGIRIEDDVLVTDDGTRVLGDGLAKSIDAVERMAQLPAHAE